RPVTRTATHLAQEIAQQLRPEAGVDDLRVELDAYQAVAVPHRGGGRVVAGCRGAKARRHAAHNVAMAHPDGKLGWQTAEDRRRRVADADHGRAVLAFGARLDFAPK